MINENKVKMIFKLSAFEKKTRKTEKELLSLTRSKVIGAGIWWTIVATTLAYIGFIILRSLINLSLYEDILLFIDSPVKAVSDLNIWIVFAVLQAVFIIIAYFYYGQKYYAMSEKLEEYRRRQNNYKGFYNKLEE